MVVVVGVYVERVLDMKCSIVPSTIIPPLPERIKDCQMLGKPHRESVLTVQWGFQKEFRTFPSGYSA